MVDPEKVIKGLEHCVEKLDTVVNKAHGFNCVTCPYFRKCDRSGYLIGLPLMRDVLALLKAQEPRVMNFSDIQTMSKVDVYLEDHGSDLVYPLMLLGAENSNKSQAVFFHPMTVKPLSAYGKTWRCWTSRPTDEQREMMKWDD